MRLRELIEDLQELAEVHGDDLEVRIATQPRHPLAFDIRNVAVVGDNEHKKEEVLDDYEAGNIDEEERDAALEELNENRKPPRVFIATESGSPREDPYAPREAWD